MGVCIKRGGGGQFFPKSINEGYAIGGRGGGGSGVIEEMGHSFLLGFKSPWKWAFPPFHPLNLRMNIPLSQHGTHQIFTEKTIFGNS